MNEPSLRLEVSRIKGSDDLPVPPIPQPPEFSNSAIPMRGKLKHIQAYITSLEYNYTGEAFFVKKKDRGFRHVTSTAKLIIREALPIQCVEAVFVGAYLTADMAEVDRFPVCFRSSLDGRVYRHIVLAVRSGGKWGSLGLSRRDTLMYKELKYELFSKLVGDFRESYASSWHRLEQVWVGFPLPHDISSNVAVKWKVMRANVGTDPEWSSAAGDLNRFVACANSLFESFTTTGKLPDHPLLSNSTDTSSGSSSNNLSPSAAASSGNGEEERGAGWEEDPTDPRGSPGGQSPGVRSPGFPPCWLAPEGSRGRRGGRWNRRASTPFRPTKSGGGEKENGEIARRGGAGGGSTGGAAASSGCSDDPNLVASPPRPRSRSVVVGGGRGARRGAVRGRGAGFSGSPGKSRRRESKSNDKDRDDKSTRDTSDAAGAAAADGVAGDGGVATVPSSGRGEADSNEAIATPEAATSLVAVVG